MEGLKSDAQSQFLHLQMEATTGPLKAVLVALVALVAMLALVALVAGPNEYPLPDPT